MNEYQQQKLMEIINQRDSDIKSLINLLEQLAEKRLDLKFEYDGGTHCTICGEIYSNLDILDRLTLENCSHQAHRQCIYKHILQNVVGCRDEDCLQVEKYWSNEWMQGIKDQEELKNQVLQKKYLPQIQQIQQPKTLVLKCEDCKIELIEADPISLGNCDHLYCKQCCISIMSAYRQMDFYQQNQLVCPLCKKQIDGDIVKIIDFDYWNIIHSKGDQFDKQQQLELYDQNEQLQQYQQLEQQKRNQICVVGDHILIDIEKSVTNVLCQHMYCREHFNEMIAEYQYFSKFLESEVICLKCKQPLDLQVIDNNDPNYFATIMQLRYAQD